MHMPDGYLDLWISILLMIVTALVWIFAYHMIYEKIGDEKVFLPDNSCYSYGSSNDRS